MWHRSILYLGTNVSEQYDDPNVRAQTVAVERSSLSREGYDRILSFARRSYAFGLLGRSLKIEAAYSSETMVLVYQSTRCVDLEYSILHVQCRDSLRTHEYLSFTHGFKLVTGVRTDGRTWEPWKCAAATSNAVTSWHGIRMGIYGWTGCLATRHRNERITARSNKTE
jgi:hypothetical protein